MASPRHKQHRPSPARVQDWIVSVINPLCRALNVEQRFLPDGPLYWIHTRRAFEYFSPLRDQVPVEFEENLSDFERKDERFARLEAEHDKSLDVLNSAAQGAFDRLVGPGAATLRQNFDRAREQFRAARLRAAQVAPQEDPSDFLYWASYVASMVTELGPRFSLAEFFNANRELRQDARTFAKKELDALAAAARDHAIVVRRMLEYLEARRTELADEYGVRIKPVPTEYGATDHG